MFNIGMPELVIILVIVLIIFGAGKLPEIGSGLGKGIRNFKKSTRDVTEDLEIDGKKEEETVKVESETEADPTARPTS